MAKVGNSSSYVIGSDDAANSETKLKKPTSTIIVAAIDFGTTYSGYAYSIRNEYKKNHLKVYANPTWSDGDGLLTLKAPTAVLFDKQGTFHSFGFEAESHYADLAEKAQHYGWQYFKRFKMKLFANKGGLPEDQFTIALEPECAAIFCKESEMFKSTETNQPRHLKAFDPGSQFMIVDMGGGTVDITAHEVTNNSTLRELIVPSGGPWGGIVVDAAFTDMFTEMFTKEVIEKFNKKFKIDALDLERIIVIKKRNVKGQGNTMRLTLPQALIEIFEKEKDTSFAATIKKGAFAQTVNNRHGKLICDTELFIEMFRKPKEEIIKHLKNILTNMSLKNLNTILLVGGFAESQIMRDAISEALKPKTVIWPNEAGLAVVKGISAAVPYDDNKHPIRKKVVRYGIAKCEDIFKVFIEKDTEVVPDKTDVEKTFNCPYIGAPVISVAIYKSSEKQPMFIDDKDSKKVGELELQLRSKSSDPVQVINVKMIFGKTQLEVQARQHGGSQGGVKAKFNFLA